MSYPTMDEMKSAVDDYHEARRQAMLKEIIGRLTGKKVDLLSFDEVRKKLKARTIIDRGMREIPLDAIVGSVNRYQDFTAGFLPRQAVGIDRWARVEVFTAAGVRVPAIDVYQIGEVYFVKDGNHRVSASRQLGLKEIQAHVEEVLTSVPLTPDTSPDKLILMVELAGFLELSGLAASRPQSNLEITVPGQYSRLEEHIEAYRNDLQKERDADVSYEEAAASWYDQVYIPVAETIENTRILRDFPGRTVTDLYIWSLEHRLELQEQLGQQIRPEAAIRNLVSRFSRRPGRLASRLGSRLRQFVLPKRFEGGPAAGEWRKEKQALSSGRKLFPDILVLTGVEEGDGSVFLLALDIAQREGARLHGLHLLRDATEQESFDTRAHEAGFLKSCAEAGVEGELTFAVGSFTERVVEQARWNDLVISGIAYSSTGQPLSGLHPAYQNLVQRCASPLLAVPRQCTLPQRALLAYDGSPKAREALFLAAYLAGEWKLPLVVMTSFEGKRVSPETLAESWDYLESHGVDASYVKAEGPVVTEILITAEEQGCDFFIMGGHRGSPLLQSFLGNTVDEVLRASQKPVLVCR